MIKTTLENQYYVVSRFPVNRDDFTAELRSFSMTYISSNYDENRDEWRNYFSAPAHLSEEQKQQACFHLGKYIGVNDYKVGRGRIMTD